MFYRPDLTSLGCLWFLTTRCNYSCPYCFDQEKKGPVANWDFRECMAAFRRLKAERGLLQIDFSGGEPSIHPLFFPFLRELSQEGHVLFVVTNLSVGAPPFMEAVSDPARCWINASLHLGKTEVLPFYREVVRLHEAGFHVNCSTVLYPPYLEQALAAQAFFKAWLPDVYFGLQVFFGEFQGNVYPQAYSPEERGRLQEVGVDVAARAAGVKVPPGTLCRTGQEWFTIRADGTVVRCPADVPLRGEKFPHFSLSDQALPCPLSECWCSDMHGFWRS